MKVKITHTGPITPKELEINLSGLTIICGPNDSGKSALADAIGDTTISLRQWSKLSRCSRGFEVWRSEQQNKHRGWWRRSPTVTLERFSWAEKVQYCGPDELCYPYKGALMPITPINVICHSFVLCKVRTRGCLFILDTPETGLHPEDQVKLAQEIVRWVNRGAFVVVVTHSDYIVREVNVCIMLHELSKNSEGDAKRLKKLADANGYTPDLFLDCDKVTGYETAVAEDKINLKEVDKDPQMGIKMNTFDEVIVRQRMIGDDIIWGDCDDHEQ